MYNTRTMEEIHRQINVKREELIKIGLTKGLQDKETILISQQLDQLLNKVQKVTSTRTPPRTS